MKTAVMLSNVEKAKKRASIIDNKKSNEDVKVFL